MRRKFIAEQYEFAEVVSWPRVELPAQGSVLTISGAGKANGDWRVKSAIRVPGGMFIGLEVLAGKRARRGAGSGERGAGQRQMELL